MLKYNLLTSPATSIYSETSPTAARNRTKKGTSWIQRALQGLPDFLHVVSLDGRIRYVSDSCKAVVGHGRAQLLDRFVRDFIHPDDLDVFVKELNEVFVYGNPVRFIYRFWSLAKDWIILESQCNIYQDGESSSIAGHRELIIMARPYVSKSGTLFDSFLEHRIAYERLVQQANQLAESEEEAEMPQDTSLAEIDGICVAYARPSRAEQHQIEPRVQVEFAALTPKRKSAEASAYLRELDVAIVQADRTVFVGDLGIPVTRISKPQKGASRKSRKKLKETKRYICTTCGAVESPEWRKGPNGPKTLCNSCGLRWAKNERAQ